MKSTAGSVLVLLLGALLPEAISSSSPTRTPTRAPVAAANSGSSNSSDDSALSFHNLVFIEMLVISIALALLLGLARARIPGQVKQTPNTAAYTIVTFTYIDLVVSVPLSIMTAVANFSQISALYGDAAAADNATSSIDSTVAAGMIAVRVLVALVSLYLLDASLRRTLWSQFVLLEYLQSLRLIWIVIALIVLVDPSQIRLLPFMKSPFSEHSGGYPNLGVFTICAGCTIASSMCIFTLSAASMAFVPLQECLFSTVLSGLWFVLTSVATLVRISRPVDVDEILDGNGGGAGGMGGGSMTSYPRRDVSESGRYSYGVGVGAGAGAVDSPLFGTMAAGGHGPSPSLSPGGGEGDYSTSTSANTQRNSLRLFSPNLYAADSTELELPPAGVSAAARLATKPIRSPTPPKRASLSNVLDNIPAPALSLDDARVPSRLASYEVDDDHDHDQQQQQQHHYQEGGGEDEYPSPQRSPSMDYETGFAEDDEAEAGVGVIVHGGGLDEPEMARRSELDTSQIQQRRPFF